MTQIRDIVLVTGAFATGKTYAIQRLKQLAAQQRVPYEETVLSDGQTILQNIEADDARGGFNHYHPWCIDNTEGHSHNNGEPQLPTILYGNEIIDAARTDLFASLEHVPSTGKLWFAELAGGANTNPSHRIEATVNYSLGRLAKMIEQGAFPKEWMQRIYAVIHTEADFDLRLALNDRKTVNGKQEVQRGFVSASNTEAVMQIAGRDDFSQLGHLLERHGAHIFTVENTGEEQFDTEITRIAEQLFSMPESQKTPHFLRKTEQRRDIVLVTGRNASGGKIIIHDLLRWYEKQGLPIEGR